MRKTPFDKDQTLLEPTQTEDDPALPLGKLPAALLRELLATDAEPPPELLVPPRLGEDFVAEIRWVDGTTIDAVRRVEG